MDLQHSRRKEILRLSVLAMSVIACSLAIVGTLVQTYGPSGDYLGKNILLTPENLKSLNFVEQASGDAYAMRYVFDRIQFISKSAHAGGAAQQKIIDIERYTQLFSRLSNERSLKVVDEAILDRFHDSSSLLISVAAKKDQGRLFQSIDFSTDGNYVRILVRDDAKEPTWAYFHIANIGNEASQIFGI